jgi:uncharacterized protein YtpQ (UPF0354 family)
MPPRWLAADRITATLCRVVVWSDDEETYVTWVDERTLARWAISKEELYRVAAANMARLMASTPVEMQSATGAQLGLLVTSSMFKASLIFSPNFRDVIGKKVGWPTLAVIPCRDFALVFGTKDEKVIDRLGPSVLKEYTQSGYPITTEVLLISDEGIRAIGQYERPALTK